MQTTAEYDKVTNGLANLRLNGAPDRTEQTTEQKAEKSPNRDWLLLSELGIVDADSKLLQPFSFDSKIAYVPKNLNLFLDGDRTGKSSIRTVLGIILRRLEGISTAPCILGEEVKSLLGWEYICEKYLQLVHQKDNTLSLEDCLCQETIDEARSDCQQVPKNLTILIHLTSNVQNHQALINIHDALKLGLNSSLSALSLDEPCSFSYDSTIDGREQSVRFEFPVQASPPSINGLQVVLSPECLYQGHPPLVYGNALQWCIDTMLKLRGKNLLKMMLGYVRDGIDTRGQAEMHIRKELSVIDTEHLFAFWEKCSVDAGHKEQSALAFCQLCVTTGRTAQERASFAETLYGFITKVLEEDGAKIRLIEHLLYSKNIQSRQTGVELLLGLPGNTDCKCRWITKSLKAAPDIALRLIQQVESDSKVTENDIERWLEASPQNNRTLIWHHLVTSRSGRWAGLCLDPVDTQPFTGDVKKVLQRSLKPFVAGCIAANNPERAVRFMKAYHDNHCQGFDADDKCNLLLCVEQPIAKDLVDWYFTLHGLKGTIPYKFQPARQIRVFLQILINTPKAIQNSHADYMQQLYTRIPDEEKALLATEISEAKELSRLNKKTFDAIFSVFFAVQTEEPKVQVVALPETVDLQQSLDPNSIPDRKDQIAATLKELETRAEPLTKKEKSALRTLLKPFMAKAKEHKCYSLAVRFVKVTQLHECTVLDGNDLSDLRTCAQERLDRDLASWYLAQEYKKDPVGQMRVIIRVAKDYPACMKKVGSLYIQGLYDSIQDRAARELFQRDIKELKGIGNQDELFKAFFPAAKVKQAPHTPAKPTVRTKAETAESWIQTLSGLGDKLLFDELAGKILELVARKQTMPTEMSREIWLNIFKNPQWLITPKTLVIFEEIKFFKNLLFTESKHADALANTLSIVLALLKTHSEHATKYLPFAYQWYALLTLSHGEKMRLGLSLLTLYKPTDSQKTLEDACKVMDELIPHLDKCAISQPPANRQQEPADASLDAFRAFAVATKPLQTNATVRGTMVRLATALGKLESAAAHRFAAQHFWDYTHHELQEALWPSVKQIMHLVKEETAIAKALHQPIATVRQHLLKNARVEILLEVLEDQFMCTEINILENSASPALSQRQHLEAVQEYTDAFTRLVLLCIASTQPEHLKRYFIVDVSINKFHQKQAKQILDIVPNYQTMRLKLFLRYLQYSGFDKTSELLLAHVLWSNRCEAFYTSAHSFRFYSYARKFCDKSAPAIEPNVDEQIGSVCPTSSHGGASQSLPPDMHFLLYTALSVAKKNKKNPLHRDRLLDFAVQTIRNLMERYPQAFDCIRRIAQCIGPDDPLFGTHQTIVCSLLRKAVRRGIIAIESPDVATTLASIQKTQADLVGEDLASLEKIKDRLSAIGEDNLSVALVVEQNNLLMWQESQFVGAYEARQSVIDACLAIWKKHPAVLKNRAVLDSMKAVMLPNSVPFGLHDGPAGKQAAAQSLESYFDCYYEIYQRTVKESPDGAKKDKTRQVGDTTYIDHSEETDRALLCLNTMVRECKNAKLLHAYDGDYDRLVRQLEKIIGLFAKPCYFECITMFLSAQSLTALILEDVQNYEDRVKRAKLSLKWLECVQTLKGQENDDLLIGYLSNAIAKSTCILHFTLDELQTLVINVDDKTRGLVVAGYEKIQQEKEISEIPDNLMNCLYLICHTWAARDPNGALVKQSGKGQPNGAPRLSDNGKVAKRCLQTMIYALRKSNVAKKYAGNYSRFIQHAMQIMMLLEKPCYLGLSHLGELTSTYIDILISEVQDTKEEALRAALLYDWLRVVRTYRGEPIYKSVLTETIDKMINAKIVGAFGALKQPEQDVLLACLEDLKGLGAAHSAQLEVSLGFQLNEIRIAKEFAKTDALLDQVFKELE